ncbi:hypothetical protein K493DRAFT_245835 [Basidiobolus meristosporus CBS 931.73]|uniref:chitin synthase n=1 Tax=Basidiobolus meristosporus CBS 931.73 TaxID=1314790 RepID=A0A1Y1WU32_9FUNG|nr:hypothetical protein K493DRAFT_245835 [Basidiobolus meristosporus CBS 931.73]|eukprot:ORX76952.1 hypothetical protein K493DRAFT_245835 [Basidiobolus meristosporus CBS 931.73]
MPNLYTSDEVPLGRRRTLTRPERQQQPTPMIHIPKEKRFCDPWTLFSNVVTFWAPGFLLAKFGMSEATVRQAWREKVALCITIAFIGGLVVFLTLGMPYVFCPQSTLADLRNYIRVGKVPGTIGVNGLMYYTQEARSPSFINFSSFSPGADLTNMFLHDDFVNGCQDLQLAEFSAVAFNPCSAHNNNQGCRLPPIDVAAQMFNLVDTSKKAAYDWDDLPNNFFVIDGNVLNLTPYLDAFPNPIVDDVIDEAIREAIYNRIPDATRIFSRRSILRKSIVCLSNKYFAGYLSKPTPGCFGVKLFFILSLVIILGVVLTKFTMAVIFNWFLSFRLARKPPKASKRTGVDYNSPWMKSINRLKSNGTLGTKSVAIDDLFSVLLVTCYSEGEASLRCTIESLADTVYEDNHKLLFIVADGIITGSGNDKSTPDICVDLLELDPAFSDPVAQSYIAVAAGSKQHNMAKVYAGHFNHGSHRVPTILVVKCGTPEEQALPKPGNRGKRDSQIILMNFFSRITYNDRLTPLDYELFMKIYHLMGVTPDYFEVVLMVDADTKVYPDSLQLLVNCMQNDPLVMGLCGETKIANKKASWVTAIQVFEYYISHHLGKGFESVFGGVTCLPGCFCMYRLKAPKGDGSWVPIITKPEIVQQYSQNMVETLHQKNLLLLGEDRFLTTLMLRNFPNRKMMFMPQAVCKTVVPDEFRVLLSQRRRWINSTIHNLLELSLVRNLCGTFCFSMQFVVLMELIGTLTLPVAIVMTFVLIVNISQTQFSDISSYMPLILLLMILLLPAILILVTTRKLIYVVWMMIYLIALPVWNLVLPVYAYWHFDDFSWGETRKIEGEGNDDDHSKQDGVFDVSLVGLKRWEDYERARLGKNPNPVFPPEAKLHP